MTSSLPPDAAWRRTNLGHLLFAAARACSACKLRVVHGAGFDGVTDAQLALFQNIGDTGTRLTELAVRAGMTKQSMIELVDKAERQGLVKRLPDAGDGRAKIIGFSTRGLKFRTAMVEGIAAAEHDFTAAIGAANLATIRRALPTGSRTGPNIESNLAAAARRFVRDVLGAVHQRGYREVTEALLTLFRTLDLKGSRLTDIAAAGRITKQSMRILVERAEALGLVERMPDPADGRAKIIRFTAAGLDMLEEMRRGVAEAEAAFARAHGEAFLGDLKQWLGAYLTTAR